MRTSCDELCDGMGERARGIDVEDRIRVLAVVHTTLREDDGDEVNARGVEKRESRGVGKKLDVDVRDITNHVLVVVKHGQRGNTFAVHKEQSILEWTIAVD